MKMHTAIICSPIPRAITRNVALVFLFFLLISSAAAAATEHLFKELELSANRGGQETKT
jgi:hypothetical protein